MSKAERYDESLKTWWKEYADRKNDEEEEHVSGTRSSTTTPRMTAAPNLTEDRLNHVEPVHGREEMRRYERKHHATNGNDGHDHRPILEPRNHVRKKEERLQKSFSWGCRLCLATARSARGDEAMCRGSSLLLVMIVSPACDAGAVDSIDAHSPGRGRIARRSVRGHQVRPVAVPELRPGSR